MIVVGIVVTLPSPLISTPDAPVMMSVLVIVALLVDAGSLMFTPTPVVPVIVPALVSVTLPELDDTPSSPPVMVAPALLVIVPPGAQRDGDARVSALALIAPLLVRTFALAPLPSISAPTVTPVILPPASLVIVPPLPTSAARSRRDR